MLQLDWGVKKMKTKRDPKQSYTVATLILVNLACMFFNYIYLKITGSQAALMVVIIGVIVCVVAMPFLYKSVVWLTRGYGNKVLSVPIFFLLFGAISAIEIYILNVLIV